MNTEETVVLTKGELFKKKHGYSRTMAKNMKKHDTFGVDEYRKLRKEKRKQHKKVLAAKKDKVLAGKKVKASTLKKK